jgi:hypothetical protein
MRLNVVSKQLLGVWVLRDPLVPAKNYMSVSGSIRPRLSRLTFVFVGLVISVFTWGLQYKLSLYNPALSASHQIPEAKLLSKNERVLAPESSLIAGATAPRGMTDVWFFAASVLLWAPVLLLVLRSGPSVREEERERPWLKFLRATLSALFLRPPPIAA